MTTQATATPFDLEAGVPPVDGTLRPKPRTSDRISKRVLFVALLVILIVIIIFFVALNNMDNKRTSPPPKPVTKTSEASASLPDDWDTDSDSGASQGKNISLVPRFEAQRLQPPKPPGIPASGPVVPAIAGDVPAVPVAPPPLTPEEQFKQQEKLDRMARMRKAMLDGLSAKSFGNDDKGAASGLIPTGGQLGGVPNLAGLDGGASLLNGMKGALQAAMPGAPGQAKPESEQDQKLDFIRNAEKNKHSYHDHVPLPAVSRNEIKMGSYIPMALNQGVNSDLPGQVTAHVTEDVYDTITGCRLLIPAMSKVIGSYDSKVAIGQGRNLVVWNGMVFGDGSELNMAGMQAYDTSGAAGLEADVDNHYLRLFGLAFGMSMVTSAVTLSVPQPNPGLGGAAAQQSPEQIIAASLAQQYGALGAQILGKYMAVQPTLRNYPGERFMVMVPRTVVFRKVWRNRCTRNG